MLLLVRQGQDALPADNREREDLERTFNYKVRGEEITEVEIDDAFVCEEERKDHCKNCPFK